MASIDESLTEILSEIRADIRIIKHDLAEDYKLLHANGKPGLISDLNSISTRVTRLEDSTNSIINDKNKSTKVFLVVIGHIVSIGIAIMSWVHR